MGSPEVTDVGLFAHFCRLFLRNLGKHSENIRENPENIPPWCLWEKGMGLTRDILPRPISPSSQGAKALICRGKARKLLTECTAENTTDEGGKRRDKPLGLVMGKGLGWPTVETGGYHLAQITPSAPNCDACL